MHLLERHLVCSHGLAIMTIREIYENFLNRFVRVNTLGGIKLSKVRQKYIKCPEDPKFHE
jgi:hypothetical protein